MRRKLSVDMTSPEGRRGLSSRICGKSAKDQAAQLARVELGARMGRSINHTLASGYQAGAGI